MSAPESQDPDFRVPGAWLAQASKAADELLAKQVPEQGGGSPSVSMSSLDPADRLVGQEVRLAPRSRRGGSSGLIVLIVLGCIFAMALAVVIAIPPDLALYESWPQSTGDRTSEPLTSATTPMRSEAGTPKLIVEPSLGVAGKPAPIGLALRGPANDAVVLIRGLVPGMELSTGVAVAGDTWQLSARDLPYTWIAPPQDFVGSVELIAELRLPNAEVADRQILHVEWMRSSGGPGHDRVREQITRQPEIEAVPPITPPTVQHPNDRGVITAAALISAEPSQSQIGREHGKSARARGRINLHRSMNACNRRCKRYELPRERHLARAWRVIVPGFYPFLRRVILQSV